MVRFTMLRAVMVVAGLLGGFAASVGHDLWLIPPEKSEAGKVVVVRANVGMDFPKSEHAPDVSRFVKRILITPDGMEGKLEPAGKSENSGQLQFEPKQPGIYIAAV